MPNHGLPATAVFVFTFLRWIDAKALQKGTGTQGGAHVSASTRAGLLILADHFGLQIAVHTLVAKAGVPTGKKRCRPRQSASLGVQFYLPLRRARRSQEWTRACYGLIACSHGWFFRFPCPHTYQEVCMNAYIMTLIQGKKFRTRKHSSEHIRRHHRQHRSDTRPRSQREHGSTWAENGGNNHQQRDELQKMAPVPAPSS